MLRQQKIDLNEKHLHGFVNRVLPSLMVGHHSFRTINCRKLVKRPPFLNKPTAPPFATRIHPTSLSGQGNEYAHRIR